MAAKHERVRQRVLVGATIYNHDPMDSEQGNRNNFIYHNCSNMQGRLIYETENFRGSRQINQQRDESQRDYEPHPDGDYPSAVRYVGGAT